MTGRAWTARTVGETAALGALYVAPPFLCYGLTYLVYRGWQACTGGPITVTYNHRSLLIVVVAPLACWAAAGLLRLWWRDDRFRGRVARLAAAYGAVGLALLFFNARYYRLSQYDCVDGLATWWPLPAW